MRWRRCRRTIGTWPFPTCSRRWTNWARSNRSRPPAATPTCRRWSSRPAPPHCLEVSPGERTMFRKLLAECVGTLWLVLGGCGSAVLAAGFPDIGIGLLGVSLAFGLTVLTAAYALGPISGGHFNPAVTVGLATAGRFPLREVPGYVIAQVVGAIAGAGLVYLIASGKVG